MELVWDNSHFVLPRKFGVKEFGEVLEKAMQRDSKETAKKSFAPSGLGYSGSCPRYWYYAFNGGTFNYDADGTAVANMNAGTDSGVRIAKMLSDAGILVTSELPLRHSDPPIFGFVDAIIDWHDEELVVEVKTCRNAAWNKRALNNEVPGYQMIQLLIYMYVMDKDKGIFLTENKDTHQLFVKPVKMTEENRNLVESTFSWMREVYQNAISGELPERPFNKSSMQCKGCALRDTCWDGWTRGSVNGEDPNPGTITLPVLELPNK